MSRLHHLAHQRQQQQRYGGPLVPIRAMDRKRRANLKNGKAVQIFDHEGDHVADTPLRLFETLSNKPEVLITKDGVGRIILPEYILPVAVKDLASRVLNLADPDQNVVHMATTDNLFKDL